MNFLKLNYIHYLLIAFTLSVFFFVYIAINNSDEVIGDTMIIDNLTTESNQRWVFLPIELWVEYLLAALN